MEIDNKNFPQTFPFPMIPMHQRERNGFSVFFHGGGKIRNLKDTLICLYT